MKKIVLLSTLLLLSGLLTAQGTIQLAGYVRNSKTQEGIPDVIVTVNYPAKLATSKTDTNGRFIINNVDISIKRCEMNFSHEYFISKPQSANINGTGSIGPFHLDPITEAPGFYINVFNNKDNLVKDVYFISSIAGAKKIKVKNGRFFYEIDEKYSTKSITLTFISESNKYKDEVVKIKLNNNYYLKVILKKKYLDEVNQIDEQGLSRYPIQPGHEQELPLDIVEKLDNATILLDDFVRAEFESNKVDYQTTLLKIKGSSLLTFLYNESKILFLQSIAKDSTKLFKSNKKTFNTIISVCL